MLALLVRRTGRRIQPRARRPARGKAARPARNHFRQKIRHRSSPESARIMVAAAGLQCGAAPRCTPGSTPGIFSPAPVTAPAVLSRRGCSRRGRTAAEAVLAPRPDRNNPARRTLKTGTSTHLGRQRSPAASNLRTNSDLRGWYGQYLLNEQAFLGATRAA